MEQFADGWITRGWVYSNDLGWIEVGGIPSVTTSVEPGAPDLTLHNVAGLLNDIIAVLRTKPDETGRDAPTSQSIISQALSLLTSHH